jgi:hypothetical protein
MKVRVRVEDETGVLVRQYDGIDWRLLEPVMTRVDRGLEVAGRVGEATELVGDLVELLSGGRAKRKRRIRR